jgi:adenylate cyclase
MADEYYRRKLAAIFSADVAGYSRLMGEDEAATVKTLETYKQIMFSLIKQHRGRVIDAPGDNLLAEFVSVVDAVQCGVAVQKELKARNTYLPENRKMQFRIGINLGDVIEEGERIYGDGVNIAARLESLADPGGICVSRTAFDQIESKLPYGYDYLGDQRVKNIAKPLGAYRVLMDPRVMVLGKPIDQKFKSKKRMPILIGLSVVLAVVFSAIIWQVYMRRPIVEPASIEKKESPLTPGKLDSEPSIAVLPFTNLTGESQNELLSDAISEDIINALSRIPKLVVIARNSAFAYKGRAVKVQEIGKDLGVRYILEGNVRQADNRIRVSAQLVDAVTGKSRWADTYDLQSTDLFAMQEEIAFNIISALQINLTEGFQAKLWAKKANNLEAYIKLMQGAEYLRKFTKEDNRLARNLAEEAAALDPDYAGAYRVIGWTHLHDARFRFSESSALSSKKAMEMAQKALGIDDKDPGIYWLFAGIHLFRKEHDLAVSNIVKASEMDPNGADILAYKALCLNYAGEPLEALSSIQRAKRLNPHCPGWYHGQEGLSYHLLRDHQKSLEAYSKARDKSPGFYSYHAMLVICFVQLGREAEAKAEAMEVLKIKSDFSMNTWAGVQLYKDPAILENEIAALQKVGLK